MPWSLEPSGALPCWVFDKPGAIHVVCPQENPNRCYEGAWLEQYKEAGGELELSTCSIAYPLGVRPGTEITIVTRRGVSRHTIVGVDTEVAIRSDGDTGLRYAIGVDGWFSGAGLAVGRVHEKAVLEPIAMSDAPSSGSIAKKFTTALADAREAVDSRSDDHGPPFMRRPKTTVTWWRPTSGFGQGVFVVVTEDHANGRTEWESDGMFSALGFVADERSDIVWLLPPRRYYESTTIDHVVDLDGDGTPELLVVERSDDGERRHLFRKTDHGFESALVYWIGG